MKLRPVDNPPNPYESRHAHWLEPPPTARLEVLEDHSRSILSRNESPDIPFRWSVNPYRGCQHGCAYCYARPTHEYLGFGAGTDFETRLTFKPDAAPLLRKALSSPKWGGESVTFSGVTDCYQPLEAVYGLTRACLEVCLEFKNPVSIITKGFLVVRDLDLLSALNRVAEARVDISLAFADESICAAFDPQAPPPRRRLEAIRRIREAGIPVGVMVSPIIPGLNDSDVPWILEQAASAGAQHASYTALRLPGSVKDVFLARLREAAPLRADRVIRRLRQIRGGALNDSRFGKRMRGEGVHWDSIREMFSVFARRFGLKADDGRGSLNQQPPNARAEPGSQSHDSKKGPSQGGVAGVRTRSRPRAETMTPRFWPDSETDHGSVAPSRHERPAVPTSRQRSVRLD